MSSYPYLKWGMPPRIVTTFDNPGLHPPLPDSYPAHPPHSPVSPDSSSIHTFSPSSPTASSTYVGTFSSNASVLPPSSLTASMSQPLGTEEKLHDEERDRFVGLGSLPDVPGKTRKKYSITRLAKHAILGSKRQMLRACEIRSEIVRVFPSLEGDPKLADKLRHDLSFYKQRFKRHPKGASDAGKGDYWSYIGDNSSSCGSREASRSMSPSQRGGDISPARSRGHSKSTSKSRSLRGLGLSMITPVKPVADMTRRSYSDLPPVTVTPMQFVQPPPAPITIPGRPSHMRSFDGSEDTSHYSQPFYQSQVPEDTFPMDSLQLTTTGNSLIPPNQQSYASHSYAIPRHDHLAPNLYGVYPHPSPFQNSNIPVHHEPTSPQFTQSLVRAQPSLSQFQSTSASVPPMSDETWMAWLNIEHVVVEQFPPPSS